MKNLDLREYLGALAHLKTLDSAAMRRKDIIRDDDYPMIQLGSPYAVDAMQKLMPSKGIRRLAFKTQVLAGINNPHVRNRLTHVFETIGIATAIARILGLNEELCFAQALGHDIGHTPFGHFGERIISELTGKKFHHKNFGIVIVRSIERRGWGLNLTMQTENGIQNHSRGSGVLLVEDKAAAEDMDTMYSDKFAYICSDINDIFFKSKLKNFSDFVELKTMIDFFGRNQRERVHRCIYALCRESAEKGHVCFQNSEEAELFERIKKIMYRRVYETVDLTGAKRALETVYERLAKLDACKEIDTAVILALMTDNEVFSLAKKDSITADDLAECSVGEILNSLRNKEFNWENPELS